MTDRDVSGQAPDLQFSLELSGRLGPDLRGLLGEVAELGAVTEDPTFDLTVQGVPTPEMWGRIGMVHTTAAEVGVDASLAVGRVVEVGTEPTETIIERPQTARTDVTVDSLRLAGAFGVLRRLSGLTQGEVAEAAGISTAAVSGLETGIIGAVSNETVGRMLGAVAEHVEIPPRVHTYLGRLTANRRSIVSSAELGDV